MKKRSRAHGLREQKLRRIVKIGIVVCAVLTFLIFVSVKLRPLMQDVTGNIAKQMMVSSMHQVVLDELNDKHYQYEDFVNVQRDGDGGILAISLNMVNVNKLKSEIALTIQQSLGESRQKTGVPVGTLTGLDLLRGHGPKIPLRISALGNISVDLKSAFDSAGINQTRHRIYLEITADVYAYMTGVSSTATAATSVPVAETVIVGEVPQMYADMTPGTGLGSAGSGTQTQEGTT